jgi:glutamate/tyrosine decarboxylase-like PLP-dependent enzyme
LTISLACFPSVAPFLYVQFLCLGHEGYTKIMRNCLTVAKRLRAGLEASGHFRLLSSPLDQPALPIVTVSVIKERPDGETVRG